MACRDLCVKICYVPMVCCVSVANMNAETKPLKPLTQRLLNLQTKFVDTKSGKAVLTARAGQVQVKLT